jgi:2-oxoglutarate ferredoxin oxidoreductase subunit alpha
LLESLDQIKQRYGQEADYMRVRAYPFSRAIHDFVAAHERIYVVEQNRDAQLACLLKIDLPAVQLTKLRSILHYNGLPVDAESITEQFAAAEFLIPEFAAKESI